MLSNRPAFLMILLLAFPLALVTGGGSVRDSGMTVLYRSEIFLHPSSDPYDLSNRYGFNHAPSVVALPDGRLLAAWFSGPFEASVHQLILGANSSDQGRTWSEAVVLQDFPRTSDFDPAFILDAHRAWLFFSAGRHNRYPFVQNEKAHVGPDSFKTFYRKSDDSGKTWSEPVLAYEKVFCRSNGIRLSTGELLLPVYQIDQTSGVLKSSDGGQTWRHFGGISSPAGAGEPTIAELTSGEIIMVLRTRDGFLWITTSEDRGETWRKPTRTNLTAAQTSHKVLSLRDGRLLLVHNESAPPVRTNLTARISGDDGKTWNPPLQLAQIDPSRAGDMTWVQQVTYPSAAELADGTVIVVWTDLVVSDTVQFGDILATRIRID